MVRKHGVDSLAKGYCIFCQTDKDDTDKLGQMYTSDGMTVHYFCMLFASGLSQNGKSEEDGIMGFLPADIMKEVRRAMRLRCIYCKRIGATVGCVMSRCRAVFHMPCGLQNGALNQFMGEFRSYCATHRPQQNMPPSNQVSSSSTVCIICMNKVAMHPSNTVLYTPCCRSSWFHRDCLQHHAISSGLHFFRCPLCNDKDLFQNEMLKFGIYIPDQDAAWEREPNAFQDLLIRYGQCDVNCKCPHGRKYEKKSSKWDIVLCDWCGSSGTHLACSNLKSALDDWICEECYKICGNDQTKKKKKTTNSVKRRKWTEARSYVHSVTQKSLHARHRNTSVGCRLRKRMRSDRQVSDGGWSTSSDCQRLISDHVVLGSRLNDWTAEERKFGYQAQVRLTRMTADMITEVKAALLKHTSNSWSVAGSSRQSNSCDACGSKCHVLEVTENALRDEEMDVKSCSVRTIFSDSERNLKRMAVTLNNCLSVAMNSNDGTVAGAKSLTDANYFASTAVNCCRQDIVDDDSSVTVNSSNEAVAVCSMLDADNGHPVATDSYASAVKNHVRKDAASKVTPPVPSLAAETFSTFPVTKSLELGVSSANESNQSHLSHFEDDKVIAIELADVPVVIENHSLASSAADLANHGSLTAIKSTHQGSFHDADQSLPGQKFVHDCSMEKSLTYPEFIDRYFRGRQTTLFERLMHYQCYLRKGVLPNSMTNMMIR